MVLGDADDKALGALYKEAWTACIAALASPLAHTLSFFTYLPLPVVPAYALPLLCPSDTPPTPI
jgi:hypothetical protein